MEEMSPLLGAKMQILFAIKKFYFAKGLVFFNKAQKLVLYLVDKSKK